MSAFIFMGDGNATAVLTGGLTLNLDTSMAGSRMS